MLCLLVSATATYNLQAIPIKNIATYVEEEYEKGEQISCRAFIQAVRMSSNEDDLDLRAANIINTTMARCLNSHPDLIDTLMDGPRKTSFDFFSPLMNSDKLEPKIKTLITQSIHIQRNTIQIALLELEAKICANPNNESLINKRTELHEKLSWLKNALSNIIWAEHQREFMLGPVERN